ncbi:MAG: hypothetical protein ACLFOY_17335 [Desulfatibacillaceae bacterium]
MRELTIRYTAQPTLARFHRSPAFYRGVLGPVGSGKSTACCAEIMARALRQEPGADGLRRSRWVVVRNTYRELADTTVKTWLDWFPEDLFGPFEKTRMRHVIRSGDVGLEVLFRALDRPSDVKKLLSLELTGGWVNEAREVPKSIVDALGDRVGRYPPVREGGCTWRGVIMDTNPPDDDHWWYRLAEEERPRGWEFFRQPGGLLEQGGTFVENPAAENLGNLESGYYLTRMAGKPPEHVRVYYCAQYGFVADGRPVYPEYADAVHCVSEDIAPDPGAVLYVGIDFGLTPAAVFGQRLAIGRWVWLDELVTEQIGAVRFAELLGEKLRGEFAGMDVAVFGDPAGEQRSQVDERTPFQILAAHGIAAKPAPTNDFVVRREAVARPLSRIVDGKPGLLVSPKCRIVRKGMAGGYSYKRVAVAGEERFRDKPDKNRFSHPCEAAQYLMVGAGEGLAELKQRRDRPRQRYAGLDYDPVGGV